MLFHHFNELLIIHVGVLKKQNNTNKAIAVMCLAHLRAFIQQTNTHKHKQPRLDEWTYTSLTYLYIKRNHLITVDLEPV